jgi:hypothetical protein
MSRTFFNFLLKVSHLFHGLRAERLIADKVCQVRIEAAQTPHCRMAR